MDSFGTRLQNCRRAQGLSQKELADNVSTSDKMISRYENDQVKPSIVVAAHLAKVLNTSVGYLMGESRFPEDPELESIFKDVLTVPESEQIKIKNTLISLLKVTKAEFLGNMMKDSKPDSSPK